MKRLRIVVDSFLSGKKLAGPFCDHKLRGKMRQYSELHLFPDILLVYEFDYEKEIITLAMIGSHSEVFG